MTNHVHLLLTPASTDAVPRLISWLGLQYVGYINRKYERTGTLWDSRYKSSIVQTEQYVLACQRYIELNPVRAAIVAHPCNYRWSSCRFHALGQSNPMLVPRPEYLALGTCATERRCAYRGLVEATLDEKVTQDIRLSVNQDRAFGDRRFHMTMHALTGRHSMPRSRGRPRREKGA